MPARYLGKQNAQRARSIENGVPLVCANAGRAECASLSLCSAAPAQALTRGVATAADVNDSRIIGPDGQGPEQQLALATNKEELLVADIVPQAANGVKRQLARDGSRAIFKELAEEMAKAALEAEGEKTAARL